MRAATGGLRGFWFWAGAVRGNELRRARPTAQRKPGRLQHPLLRGHSKNLNLHALEHAGSEDIHGIGETLLPPVMAAIGNAVYNAVGVRIHDLPVTAEKVLRELGRAGASPRH